ESFEVLGIGKYLTGQRGGRQLVERFGARWYRRAASLGPLGVEFRARYVIDIGVGSLGIRRIAGDRETVAPSERAFLRDEEGNRLFEILLRLLRRVRPDQLDIALVGGDQFQPFVFRLPEGADLRLEGAQLVAYARQICGLLGVLAGGNRR